MSLNLSHLWSCIMSMAFITSSGFLSKGDIYNLFSFSVEENCSKLPTQLFELVIYYWLTKGPVIPSHYTTKQTPIEVLASCLVQFGSKDSVFTIYRQNTILTLIRYNICPVRVLGLTGHRFQFNIFYRSSSSPLTSLIRVRSLCIWQQHKYGYTSPYLSFQKTTQY